MIWTFLLRFWQPAVGVLAVGIIWLCVLNYGSRRFDAGVQQTRSEDSKAAAVQQALNDEQRKRDEARAQYADKQHEIDVAQLAAINARPVQRVVCHRAESHSNPVPTNAGLPAGKVANPGPLPTPPTGSADPDFDPTPALIALAAEADSIVASCRYLHMAVHGTPSSP